MTTVELRLTHINVLPKKKSCKGSPVGPSGPSSLKIVFALLAEVVAVHMQLTIVYLRHLSLKELLALRGRLFGSLVQLQIDLHELFENSLVATGARTGAGTGTGIRAGPGVGLRDGARPEEGETLPGGRF